MAWWYDFWTEELYVYARVLSEPASVGPALWHLERDLGVDLDALFEILAGPEDDLLSPRAEAAGALGLTEGVEPGALLMEALGTTGRDRKLHEAREARRARRQAIRRQRQTAQAAG